MQNKIQIKKNLRSEDEIEDLSLQSRIRSLNWVTNGFLETTLDEASSLVQEHMNEVFIYSRIKDRRTIPRHMCTTENSY